MCGRFAQTHSGEDVAAAFQLSVTPQLTPRYNIAPTQPVSVITQSRRTQERVHHPKRWGLIPGWAKDAKLGARLINARSETVATKPSFRQALQKRRCLVVADGFYEWQRSPDTGAKQPYLMQLPSRSLFAFAGLWERWQHPETQETVFSCTILTTAANNLMAPIHDRMPVILPLTAYDVWLDPTFDHPGELAGWLRPDKSEAAEMVTIAISTAINDPRHESAQVQEPLAGSVSQA